MTREYLEKIKMDYYASSNPVFDLVCFKAVVDALEAVLNERDALQQHVLRLEKAQALKSDP